MSLAEALKGPEAPEAGIGRFAVSMLVNSEAVKQLNSGQFIEAQDPYL